MLNFKPSKELGELRELILKQYDDGNMMIFSTPNISGNYDNYSFLVYIGDKYCRISMIEPRYIGLNDESIILTKDQVSKLINILKSTITDEYYYSRYYCYCEFLTKQSNIWEAIISEQLIEWGSNTIDPHLPMPDYTLLPTID